MGYEGLEGKSLMGTRFCFSLISLFIPWQVYTYIEKISVVFYLILLPSSSETLYPNKSLSSYSQGFLCVWPIEFNWVSFWSDEKLGWLHIFGSAKSHLMIHLKCLDSMTCGIYFSKAFTKTKAHAIYIHPFLYFVQYTHFDCVFGFSYDRWIPLVTWVDFAFYAWGHSSNALEKQFDWLNSALCAVLVIVNTKYWLFKGMPKIW